MPRLIAIYGSTTSHGGSIASASSTTKAGGAGVARRGDVLWCPFHGIQPINSPCSPTVKADGIPVAGVGDSTNCGAVITSGMPGIFID